MYQITGVMGINDFKLSSIQYLAANLREIAYDHSEQQCILRIFFQEHIMIIIVLIVKHTQSMRTVGFR